MSKILNFNDVPKPRVGMTLAEVERAHILATYWRCRENKVATARMLGCSMKTLYHRLNLYGVPLNSSGCQYFPQKTMGRGAL